MSTLQDLYTRKASFSAYKLKQEAFEFGDTNPDNELYAKRDRLRTELKAVTTRLTYEIAQIDDELIKAGKPKSKTDRKRLLDVRFRDEKKALDEAFNAEVVACAQRGMSATAMQSECGAPNAAPFYNALRTQQTIEKPLSPAVALGRTPEIEWLYSDHTGVHRYAVSACGNYAKMHGVDLDERTEVVLYTQDLSYFSGDRDLTSKFDATRLEMLESILEGSFTGPVRVADNPYKS